VGRQERVQTRDLALHQDLAQFGIWCGQDIALERDRFAHPACGVHLRFEQSAKPVVVAHLQSQRHLVGEGGHGFDEARIWGAGAVQRGALARYIGPGHRHAKCGEQNGRRHPGKHHVQPPMRGHGVARRKRAA